MQSLLELKNISLSYHTLEGETPALSDISFSIEEGEFVALVGPSGCGKSTILNLISGLLQPEQGEILLKGEPLSHSLVNIGYMLQRDHLFEWRTVYSNILLGLEIQHAVTREKKEKAEEMMRIYGLDGFRDARPSQLSGGMRQRVMIAMALSCHPELLIADEPTTALDVTIQAQILDLINRLRKKLGMAVLLITHDLGVVAETADRVVVMYCGRVVEQAKVLDLFTDPKHPYTRGLLDSIPKLDEDRKRLYMIKGIVPDPTHLPKGCAFADRCDHCMEKCREHMPALVDQGNGRKVRCFLESDEVEDQ